MNIRVARTSLALRLFVASLILSPAWAGSNHPAQGKPEVEHDHHKGEKDHAHVEEEKGHAHGEEEEEEAPSSVGPEKGILEANESSGIKLSPEAIRNFEIKTQKITGSGPWTFPSSARFQSGEEENLYRLRDGFFKRVDFKHSERGPLQFTAGSKYLKDGDEVVVGGIGFLRIAELAAFGGAPEGHSH